MTKTNCPHCGRDLEADQPEHCASDDCPRLDLIQRARDEYASDDLEIDDNAVVSTGEDGSWVQAWVWVREEAEA
jgi:hypothetical protein